MQRSHLQRGDRQEGTLLLIKYRAECEGTDKYVSYPVPRVDLLNSITGPDVHEERGGRKVLQVQTCTKNVARGKVVARTAADTAMLCGTMS